MRSNQIYKILFNFTNCLVSFAAGTLTLLAFNLKDACNHIDTLSENNLAYYIGLVFIAAIIIINYINLNSLEKEELNRCRNQK